HELSTIHHQPSTIDHQPSTINPQPSTINHQPSTINHQPSTINHQPSTILPKIASTQLIPSIAAEIIPPAYPAPSPQGYNPLTSMCSRVSGFLGMETGVEVLLSGA